MQNTNTTTPNQKQLPPATSGNENCLAGIRCPNCGNEDRFLISATITADVTDDGGDIERHSSMEWDDDSHTRCPDCGEDGPLAGFRA